MEQYNHLQQELEKKSGRHKNRKFKKHSYSVFRLRELIMKKARRALKKKNKKINNIRKEMVLWLNS